MDNIRHNLIGNIFALWMLYTFYRTIKTLKDETMSRGSIKPAFVVLVASILSLFAWGMEKYRDAIPAFGAVCVLFLVIQTNTYFVFFFSRFNTIFEGKSDSLSLNLFILLYGFWVLSVVMIMFGSQSGHEYHCSRRGKKHSFKITYKSFIKN